MINYGYNTESILKSYKIYIMLRLLAQSIQILFKTTSDFNTKNTFSSDEKEIDWEAIPSV